MKAARGFALVVVLWVLAGLTVVAVSVASALRIDAGSVKLLRDRVSAEAEFLSASSRLQLVLATGTRLARTVEGTRGSVPVDGRMLTASTSAWLSVRDMRGLIDLNASGTPRLIKLLAMCGIPEAQLPALADALIDYVDADDLKRLNGAEAKDYRDAQELPPRNAKLLSREELWRIKGWAPIREAWQRAGCDEIVTVHGDGRLNANTSSLRVLSVDGYDAVAARQATARGDEGEQLPAVSTLGAPRPEEQSFAQLANGRVGGNFRVRLMATGLEWSVEYDLVLSPSGRAGPWRVLEIRYPDVAPSGPPAQVATLPAIDFTPAAPDLVNKNAASRLPFGN